MNETDKVIEKGEKVLWEGKPVRRVYLVGQLLGLLILSMVLLNVFFIFFGWVVLIIGFIWIWYSYEVTHYVVTNRRVIFQSGIIGRDFRFVDFDKITNASVDVGLMDKLLGNGSGTISIMSAGMMIYGKNGSATPIPYSLSHIAGPYDVFKLFKKVSYDVKTDIEYPNEYRPSNNPGYNTDYSPSDKKPSKPRTKKK